MSQTPKPPPARVRRVLDARPLPLQQSKLKVRPFLECFDRGSGLPGLVMQGEIHGDSLRVAITGVELVLLSGSSSRDSYGPFVLLDRQEHALGAQHALRLDADADDVDVSHAAISYFELATDHVARRELAYAERWYSVYFNPLGLVDGASSGGPRSLFPRALPS
jgi:hypothetical protein